MRVRTLKVIPNPWLTLDDQANAAHVVAVDPSVNPRRDWVGASMYDIEVLDGADYLLSPRRYHSWRFTDQPVELENTAYYKNCVKYGELIAADEETAKICQVDFKPISDVLAEYKTRAAFSWRSAYGEFPEWYTPVKSNAKVTVIPVVKDLPGVATCWCSINCMLV